MKSATAPFVLFALLCCWFHLSAVEGDKILMIAPNLLKEHFKFNAHLADLLAREGRHQVHFLIVNTANEDEEEVEVPKEVSQFVPLNSEQNIHVSGSSYEVVSFGDDFHKEFSQTNVESKMLEVSKWLRREYTQNATILENEAFLVFKELAKQPGLVKRLHDAKFDLAILDTWDLGALHIFFLAGINHTIAFNKIQLLSYQLKYSGKLSENVPEVYSTKIGDGTKKEFRKQHNGSIRVFERVHKKMDDWFHGPEVADLAREFEWQWLEKMPQENWPTVEKLYQRIDHVFVDSNPLLDFPLLAEGGMPQKTHYFGGIGLREELTDKEIIHVDRSKATTVLISLLYRERMEEEGNFAFQAFKEAIKRFKLNNQAHGRFNFILDCDPSKKLDKEEGHSEPNRELKYVDIREIEDLQHELANPHTRLLVTNCSSGPVLAAIAAGVPVLCVPFFVDQFYIGEALTLHNDPHKKDQYQHPSLDLNQFTEHGDPEKVFEAFNELLETNAASSLKMAKKLQADLHAGWMKNHGAKSPKTLFLKFVRGFPASAA